MYDINFCLPPGSLLSKRPASSYDLQPSLGLSALHLACELVSVLDAECGSLLSFLGGKTSQPPELPFTFFHCLLSTMTSVIYWHLLTLLCVRVCAKSLSSLLFSLLYNIGAQKQAYFLEGKTLQIQVCSIQKVHGSQHIFREHLATFFFFFLASSLILLFHFCFNCSNSQTRFLRIYDTSSYDQILSLGSGSVCSLRAKKVKPTLPFCRDSSDLGTATCC